MTTLKKTAPIETRELINPLTGGNATFVKVIYNQKLRDSGKATLISLKIGQVINGCKVSKMTQDTWFPNHVFYFHEFYTATNKCIWVLKAHYDKMRFV